MRLISCHIENFGKLSNVDIDFNGSVHKICERNGWGKTTLSSFILSMFYGLEGTNKKKYEENDEHTACGCSDRRRVHGLVRLHEHRQPHRVPQA